MFAGQCTTIAGQQPARCFHVWTLYTKKDSGFLEYVKKPTTGEVLCPGSNATMKDSTTLEFYLSVAGKLAVIQVKNPKRCMDLNTKMENFSPKSQTVEPVFMAC